MLNRRRVSFLHSFGNNSVKGADEGVGNNFLWLISCRIMLSWANETCLHDSLVYMTRNFLPNSQINPPFGEKISTYYFGVDKWHWLLANDWELLWQDTIWKEKEFKDNISTFYRLMSNLKCLEPGVTTNLTLGREGIEIKLPVTLVNINNLFFSTLQMTTSTRTRRVSFASGRIAQDKKSHSKLNTCL